MPFPGRQFLGAALILARAYHEPMIDYGDPRNAGGPDQLMMVLVFGFIVMVLLRVFVFFG
jgi:hypothetical protein